MQHSEFEKIDMPLEMIRIGDELYSIKVAHSIEHRRLGLKGITKLPPKSGMLLIYGETRYPKSDNPPMISMCINMNLTAIFLLSSGEVAHAFLNLQAEPDKDFAKATRYYSPKPADMLLEISTEPEVKIGERIDVKDIVSRYKGEIYKG